MSADLIDLPPRLWGQLIETVRAERERHPCQEPDAVQYLSAYEPCEMCGTPVVAVKSPQDGMGWCEIYSIRVGAWTAPRDGSQMGLVRTIPHWCRGRAVQP